MKFSKQNLITGLWVTLFLIVSNLNPVKFMLMFFTGDSIVTGMNEYLYVTADKKYVYHGLLKDTLNTSCYRQYVRLFPNNSRTLHRIQPIVGWRFWRWGEYITQEKWRQPYLEITHDEIKQLENNFGKLFSSMDGGISQCRE